MCIRCHPSDPYIIAYLEDTFHNPIFNKWNMSSFSHLLIIISGYNGLEAHYLAIRLAEQFYAWCCVNHKAPFMDTDKLRDEIDNAIIFYQNRLTTQMVSCIEITE